MEGDQGTISHVRRPRLVVWVGRALVGLGCSAVLGWMALAIYFDFSLLGSPWLRAALGVLIPVGAVVALFLVRPRWVLAGILGAFVREGLPRMSLDRGSAGVTR